MLPTLWEYLERAADDPLLRDGLASEDLPPTRSPPNSPWPQRPHTAPNKVLLTPLEERATAVPKANRRVFYRHFSASATMHLFILSYPSVTENLYPIHVAFIMI